ncbi:tetratricopeptide repeat protein [Salsuginibacillus kocurii]|uniref:tetratricopeptide repeat protein n=1 Tax=Salsuginibacillus kocurii TaxID=427078 RepID=UPI0003735075|nr:hypothetical protein [Salsuginibacillus kocurii]
MTSEDNHRDNVVPFPGAVKQLIEQGLDALKQNKYEESIEKFKLALNRAPDNEPAATGLLVAYTQIGRLYEGKEWAEQLLHEGRGDYFEVLQMYITLLTQLGDYHGVVQTLEAVQSESQFPPHLAEHFFELLHLARTMAEEEDQGYHLEKNSPPPEGDIVFPEEIMHQLETGDLPRQFQALSMLKDYHSEAVIQRLKDMLVDLDINSVLKSFILFLLKDWNITQKVTIQKGEKKTEESPGHLPAMEEIPAVKRVSSYLNDQLGQMDPSLLDAAKQIWQQVVLDAYPFEPPAYSVEAWGAALHYEAKMYLGQMPCFDDLCRYHQTEEKETEECLEMVTSLDETGFPF